MGSVGENGAGKSTLMRSIAEGKLEGFPSKEQLKTCFVEHNQGKDAGLSILEFVLKDRCRMTPRNLGLETFSTHPPNPIYKSTIHLCYLTLI